MLKYSHPALAWILDYWTVTIFLPSILLLIAVLALVTHRWDGRDAAVRKREQWGPVRENVFEKINRRRERPNSAATNSGRSP